FDAQHTIGDMAFPLFYQCQAAILIPTICQHILFTVCRADAVWWLATSMDRAASCFGRLCRHPVCRTSWCPVSYGTVFPEKTRNVRNADLYLVAWMRELCFSAYSHASAYSTAVVF